MKQIIMSHWNFMRMLRLILGIVIIVQAVIGKDPLLGILGILFSSMAVFNIGCCGTKGCQTSDKKTSGIAKDISYEEVV
jgi:hypothetical protein